MPNRAGTKTKFTSQSQYLHVCHGFSHEYLTRMVLGIYNGFPESYQVLICRPSVTEEDIHLFWQRILKFPSLYVLLQVNALPVRLQEVSVVQFQ